MDAKLMFSSDNMELCTPKSLFSALDHEFHFTLDPCATEKSAKCKKYFTVLEDGLSQSWGGECVFCNPLYGKDLPRWVEKGWREAGKPGTVVVMLIPVRTDTRYWRDFILNGKADEVRFVDTRIKFTDVDGKSLPNPAPFPSAIVVFRSYDMAIKNTVFGTFRMQK